MDERRRRESFTRIAAAIGEEAATTMFELLPPDTDDRLDRAETLRNELVAIFRGELVSAVAGRTRALIVATATAVVGIGGLAVSLAQVL